ncbi:MAG: polyketide synthase, partial [Myxococcota bacterium]
MAGLTRAPLALTGCASRLPRGLGPPPPGRGLVGVGGFLERDPATFDPGAFGLSDREAATLDPMHRWLLETTRELLEGSGTPAASLPADRTGVFVGAAASEFAPIARRVPLDDAMYLASGTGAGTAAGRLAYTFGWRGEVVAVDTACSSGLVALHQACRALWDGRLDVAVVAAVNVLLDPEVGARLAASGLTSPSGQLRSFGAGADGYVRGEGCVALLVRRAPRPEDTVLAWIEGSAVNHGGATNGLTAPSPRAERDVLRAALVDAGRAPSEVGYHEGHGSGTALGDAVELEAVAEVFTGVDDLWLGSVKARIGHLEAVAGLAGLAAAVEVLRTGTIPATGEGREAPVRVAAAPTPLPRPVVTVASFGLGGTNAAVVLGKGPPPRPESGPPGPEPIC